MPEPMVLDLLNGLPTQQAIGDMVIPKVLPLVGTNFVLFVGTDVEGEALEETLEVVDLRHGWTLLNWVLFKNKSSSFFVNFFLTELAQALLSDLNTL